MKTESEDPEYLVRAQALKLLARREHSRRELTLKLIKRKFPADRIEAVLDEYEREGWLDDERFADIYARQRRDSGYGPLKIESDLQQRGVFSLPESIASMDDADWVELATRARNRRFGLIPDALEWDEKVRQGRFLLRRGFTGDQVGQALNARGSDGTLMS